MEKEDYINSLNLDIRSHDDIEYLLLEYENDKISRAEFITIMLLSHSVTYSKGHKAGFEAQSKP